MKKIFLVLLVLFLGVSLAGCGERIRERIEERQAREAEDDTQVEEVTDGTEVPGEIEVPAASEGEVIDTSELDALLNDVDSAASDVDSAMNGLDAIDESEDNDLDL